MGTTAAGETAGPTYGNLYTRCSGKSNPTAPYYYRSQVSLDFLFNEMASRIWYCNWKIGSKEEGEHTVSGWNPKKI